MRHADEFSARVLVNGKVDSRLKVPESKEDVASVIETAKTLFMDGRKRVIYDDILTVDLSGPELPMLTLVDLPGYIQTRALDQPETIVQDIEKLVQKYLAESRTIILAVVPVNRDFGTNAAIKHIQQFDGQGKRTLCASPLDITSSRIKVLRTAKRLRDETIEKESIFFARSPWSNIRLADRGIQDRGIQNLIERLTDVLSDQVEREFSGIEKDLVQQKEELSEQLRALGPAIATDLEKSNLLQRNINHVMQQFKDLIDGHYGAGDFDQDLYLRSLFSISSPLITTLFSTDSLCMYITSLSPQ
ncbi:hypothetical protein Pst134EA_017391 [Puccinia striiformis f. sp. tritici]|uniref:hypothetical protein n=1 Tax=Puccinia striiformis f. sp. tritici TaxID=168172 RepID=UPI002008A35E|nr:hypothetical protein Pst134EA_017391 [Puccinia striiformis f. sp. tritici]KAH9461082.1 hypothetical protein Pst134EA_017391 [Puccinia striiformis f. sp. tritici]